MFSLACTLREDGSCDFGPIDERFDYVLDANPHAVILPRVSLDHGDSLDWWSARYGDELQVDIRLDTGERQRPRFSFSSARWREEFAPALQAFIRHCEQRYGDHIMGYHLAAGDCGGQAGVGDNETTLPAAAIPLERTRHQRRELATWTWRSW